MSLELFNHYKAIMPLAHKWQATLASPLPVCVWANPLKIQRQELIELAKEDNLYLEPLAWNATGLRYCGEQALGRSWLYLSGLLQIQEEVAMLPVELLQLSPQDKVLDLCAAPGNKTAQCAAMMQNSGMIIANDNRYERLKAMGQIIKRLGLMNINLTVYDGVNYPSVHDFFDKVLVDVPCSCEGTLRKGKQRQFQPKLKNSLRLAVTQYGLLKKALQVCRPGGLICYATCTFAPEENEAVVNRLLQEHAGEVEVCEVVIDAFRTSPGITEWQGVKYQSELANTHRIWPQLNNTGGFYVALLRKVGGKQPVNIKRAQHSMLPEIKNTIDQIAARFAIKNEIFTDLCFDARSTRRGIYATTRHNNMSDYPQLNKLTTDCQGLFFIKTQIRYPKLSTAAAMVLGKYAKRHVVTLTPTQRKQFFNHQIITLLPEQLRLLESMGYVIVKYQVCYLGLGIYLPARDDNEAHRLQSLFPKYF